MADNTVRIRATVDDKVSGSVAKMRDQFDVLGKSKAFGNIVTGVGVGIGVAVWHSATSKIVDFIGDTVTAAREEEDSIARLGASLRANIKDWDGNTEAIERTLQSRMRLGFSDDEQRESLSRLVGATHDVTKALDLERVAMDLARFKHVDLATASEALIKIEGGQFRALKALIGSTDDIKTSTQALAAVQKVAGGQAEELANTNSGKLLASQIKVGEAMEKIGAITMPMVTEATVKLADAINYLADNTDQLSGIDAAVSEQLTKGTLKDLEQTRDAIRQGIKDLGGSEPDKISVGAFVFAGQIADLRQQLQMTESAIVSFNDETLNLGKTYEKLPTDLERTATAAGGVDEAFDATAAAAGAMAGAVGRAVDKVKVDFGAMKDKLVSDGKELINDAFDPQIEKVKLLGVNAEIAAAKRILHSSKASKAEQTDARATLLLAGKDQAELLLTLAEAGQTTSNAYKTGIADLKTEIANSSGPMKRALQGVLANILAIEKAGKVVPINFKVTGLTAFAGHDTVNGHGRAGGGPVMPGNVYTVGENGPETLVMGQNGGYVVPKGNTYNNYLTVNGDVRARNGDDIIRRMQEMSYLAAGPGG